MLPHEPPAVAVDENVKYCKKIPPRKNKNAVSTFLKVSTKQS